MRSRWLIVIACLLAFGLTLEFYRGGDVPAWTGRTIVKIGLIPMSDYLLVGNGPPLGLIEPKRNLVTRVSDPTFLAKVIGGTKFEPRTESLSKSLAASSLRAVALDDDRSVAVEVSASSSADVEAVFRSLAGEIASAHEAISQPRLDSVRSNLTDLQRRSDFLEKTVTEFGPRILGVARENRDQAGTPLPVPSLGGAAEMWNNLRDRVQRNTNLLELSEKTVIYVEPGSYPQSRRSIRPARAAILAGLAMLAAMIVLTILLTPQQQHST